MSFKEKFRNPLVQQYALEIALPLLGYLFFDWTIPVIIAFYFMDYFASEIARNRRHHKILSVQENGEKLKFYLGVFVSIVLFCGASFFAFQSLMVAGSDTDLLVVEVIEFGKSEGWYLLPVVYLASHIKDVMTFYAPRRYLKYNFSATMKFYSIEIMLQFMLICTGLYLWAFYKIPDVPALIAFVVVKILFDQLLVKKLRSYSIN
jgi:hypothetical protein